MSESSVQSEPLSSPEEIFKAQILSDYRLAVESRETSLIGRREVLTGKAKFGIFGDGKELPQIAWAKVFKPGDFRSGYYRDQTFMMAIGALSTQEFFASLYADTNHENEPASAGRQMNGHFATQSLDADGHWKNLREQKNSSADISPTAGQMPRLVGLAEASKHYRANKDLKDFGQFSNNGNEIAWGTIGNASTSEGPFFEAINAAGVLQIPMVISIWDDDYGISVHSKYQTTKENISEILKGFQRDEDHDGYEILRVKAWDYPGLIETYEKAEKIARKKHIPVMVHVTEVTQPQGHSTSGSHERYKNEQRLNWEKEFDCIKKMGEWICNTGLASEEDLKALEDEAKKSARDAKKEAWKNYINPIKEEIQAVRGFLAEAVSIATKADYIKALDNELAATAEPLRRDGIAAIRRALPYLIHDESGLKERMKAWLDNALAESHDRYGAYLYSESELSPMNTAAVAPVYSEQSETVDARIILRDNFDRLLAERPEVVIFGEDSGKIG
ncbi:MAG: thiamine pyrophosphate-dependent dehydrogenase E1 component subunit alpha, partial [Croceimicrobium sp.]